jgi:hypothetical protein
MDTEILAACRNATVVDLGRIDSGGLGKNAPDKRRRMNGERQVP